MVAALLLTACGGDDGDAVLPFVGSTHEPAIGARPTPPSTGITNADGIRIATKGDSVLVHYRGRLDDGSEFDSSIGREPLSFVVDSGQMIPGFNDAVHGMVLGEKITVRLEASEAYGERSEANYIDVPLANVPEGTKVDQQLFSAAGSTTVLAIEGDVVTLDGNHELAGQALTFEIELVDIR